MTESVWSLQSRKARRAVAQQSDHDSGRPELLPGRQARASPPDWPTGSPQQAYLAFDVPDRDEGERAVLALGATKATSQRQFRLSDATAISDACQDPDIPRFTIMPDAMTEEQARVWIERGLEWSPRGTARFAITVPEVGELATALYSSSSASCSALTSASLSMSCPAMS